jgi:Mg2+ and Co2+ transporter CorA
MSGIITTTEWNSKRSAPTLRSKTRDDQVYRLHGTISTTFYKVMEIIQKEGINIEGSVITLAEGEGSTARLLFELGADTMYNDTLISKSGLVPQRGIHVVPADMTEFTENVRWCEQMAITGGDL